MTRNKLAILGGAAMALALAGTASAAYITSMGYVDGLQWQINHAEQIGVINDDQRDQLLQLQQRTHDIAWRCNSTNDQFACQRTIRNVDYINRMIGRTGYGVSQRYYRNYDNSYDRDDNYNPDYGYGGY